MARRYKVYRAGNSIDQENYLYVTKFKRGKQKVYTAMSGKHTDNKEHSKAAKLKSLQELIEYDDDDKVISNYEMLQIVNSKPKRPTLKTEFYPTLNNLIGGFMEGEFIVITGATKMGKTLFCQSLTRDFFNDQEYPLWFTYEEPADQFLNCFPLKSEDITFYMPRILKPYDIEWVIERIKEAKLKYSCRTVFIDHLHYLFDMSVLRNPSLSIGSFVRKLKRLAIEEEIVIFLICHTNKSKVEDEEDMDYTNLRDSSFIGQEADCVLFIHRKTESDGIVQSNETLLKICFHRRTGVMQQVIPLIKESAYLKELETNY